jgi:hypothetical protein
VVLVAHKPGVAATFAYPCQVCGGTRYVVTNVEQPHLHTWLPTPGATLAFAWWQGFEQARRGC